MSPLLTGIALGAASAFMLDPQLGRRRRALLRDRIAQVRALRGGPVTDDGLVGRVRASLGRYVSHPRAVHVTVQDGIVTLTGEVLAGEHPALIGALRFMPGVKDVADRLDVHSGAEGMSSLQDAWPPRTRALVGGAGALLVVYALARGGLRGVAAIACGAALLARAKANQPLQDLLRAARGKARMREIA